MAPELQVSTGGGATRDLLYRQPIRDRLYFIGCGDHLVQGVNWIASGTSLRITVTPRWSPD